MGVLRWVFASMVICFILGCRDYVVSVVSLLYQVYHWHIYAKVQKGMCSLSQDRKNADDGLIKHLDQNRCKPTKITSSLWQHRLCVLAFVCTHNSICGDPYLVGPTILVSHVGPGGAFIGFVVDKCSDAQWGHHHFVIVKLPEWVGMYQQFGPWCDL